MENAKKTPSKGKKFNTSTIVGIGLLTAIVIVLQFISMALRFGNFSITLTLIPIVVGAALFGRKTGAWLGLVFGAAVLLTGDAAAFLTVNVFGTIATVLVKGTAAGFCAAAVYRLIAKKNEIAAVLVSSVVAPVVNTGIFLLGCRIFFYDTVAAWGEGLGFENAFIYMIVGLVGINFLIELGTNLVLNPAILRIIKIGRKKLVK
ncbi:MAG TPA: ECF transporter S component [Ruminococcaceae bacterium]|nr:ECF transporter S component [Oscillospiraceae bacterium]